MGGPTKRSPLAPETTAELPPIAGVRLASAEAQIRYRGRPDVMLALVPEGSSMAACLTQSKTRSAPVDWCRRNAALGKARAIVVNAGNANAFTGKVGDRTVLVTARETARRLGCKPEEVFIASTGVIGEPLDPAPIVNVLDGLIQRASEAAWPEAAAAIMTTDTFPKVATATARLAGTTVTINGIAKGSGMIAPDMATMLSFLFTDAALPPRILQALLTRATAKSFNCMTVDGDTSTSDTLLLCATGPAKDRPKGLRSADDPRLKSFAKALDEVTLSLALQVARDGEGAQKLVGIAVTGAEDNAAARRIGLAIANSPLVKTAIAGEDANWGRIVMAIGKSGEAADRDRLAIRIGGVLVATRGLKAPGYREADVVPHMQGCEIEIAVDVGVGKGRAKVWTCDLTHGYIDINGSYRS
ncbi:MAG: bifunctional glutamate N-acetyltransferase/amino-acid acetyltransferase ArgJ [Parvibaculaceae bacterium]